MQDIVLLENVQCEAIKYILVNQVLQLLNSNLL